MIGYPPKSEWGPGPWQAEPDKERWVSKAGLQCAAMRNMSLGNWCGYVQVPAASPLAGLEHTAYPVSGIRVHGGLTYSNDASRMTEGMWGDATGYVYGFDCGHLGDAHPAIDFDFLAKSGLGGTYKGLAYVRGECETLARQLKSWERRLLGKYGEHAGWVLEYVNEIPASHISPTRRRALGRRGVDLGAYGSVYRLAGATALDLDLGILP